MNHFSQKIVSITNVLVHTCSCPLHSLEHHKKQGKKAKFNIMLHKTQKLGRTKSLAPLTQYLIAQPLEKLSYWNTHDLWPRPSFLTLSPTWQAKIFSDSMTPCTQSVHLAPEAAKQPQNIFKPPPHLTAGTCLSWHHCSLSSVLFSSVHVQGDLLQFHGF